MKAYDKLVECGIKPSMQRIAVMDYLMTHRTHPNVDRIYGGLRDDMPTLSRTTVYNTLKLFCEEGAIQMLTIDEKNLCFDADTSNHAHFICKRCGKIYDLSSGAGMKKVIPIEIDGHKIEESHFYYKGICKKCITK